MTALIAACGSSGGSKTLKTNAAHSTSMSMSMTKAAHTTSMVTRAKHVTVSIKSYAFAPSKLTVRAGTQVTWTNHDATPHTATENNNSFDTGAIDPNTSHTIDFKHPGTYPYHCSFIRS